LLAIAGIVSIALSWLAARVLVPRLHREGVCGQDLHKPGRPEIAEMGGLALLVGFSGAVLVAVAMVSFFRVFPGVDLVVLLAGLTTVLLSGLIGSIDDLLGMRQEVKAFLPALAAIPLMAIRVGETQMTIPWAGNVDFWIFYPLFLIPVGVTVAANATNMLAGYNGLELGLGIIEMGALSAIAALLGQTTSLIVLLSGLGALLGLLHFNWYPARAFVGDVGTLSIGAVVATAVIIGGYEVAGVIVFIPHGLDFLLKAAHRFPTTGWGGELHDDGRLHCPKHGPVSLPQLIMKLTGGIHERSLVLLLMGIEALLGILAIALYLW
jgi:UDP-N-acetylglucosamine--dolichyl-phosphate N-acetylglucosaminephosphotransferase